MDWQDRTRLLLGQEKVDVFQQSHVLVAGLGGVGGMLAEMLCRAGVGTLTLVDGDTVHLTNLNRQIPALHSTLGKPKVEVVAQRLKDINPEINLHLAPVFLRDEIMQEYLSRPYDYVADAIDTLSPKMHLIRISLEKGHRLVSAMGAGGKTDPLQIRVSDISNSYNCRLAYSIRKRLHRQGIFTGFKVVFSPEPVSGKAVRMISGEQNKLTTVGTISYMPAVFGAHMAAVILMDMINQQETI
ncbi:MAG: tRNA threonylcarbamoyladenosine dehydratase [Lentimicrobiaceae bacterium]|nr:tRNA threonylcarbamoyladenosine dehydratase [Lentimicrobiaceae bacterium]